MGFKGSKVQILSSRPENRNPKGSTGTWVPFLFLAPEEPGLGAGPFPSFRCSCLPAMSRGRIIRDQTSRWSLDYGKSIGLLPAGQTGPRSQVKSHEGNPPWLFCMREKIGDDRQLSCFPYVCCPPLSTGTKTSRGDPRVPFRRPSGKDVSWNSGRQPHPAS